ncbi:MAG: serine/threonine protein kinase [Nannocystaceae bacterium]|nr:serine/threonine protein kinase [Nannocystaceae bacterium]
MVDAASNELGYSSFDRDSEETIAIGQVVAGGRYRIERYLGDGGVAVVYKAMDLRSHELVAIKVVRSKHAHRSDAVTRIYREAKLAAAIGRHPNIVWPIDVGRLPEFHRRLYLVAELAPGRPISNFVAESVDGLAVDRVCRAGRDLARALCALHRAGIIHRDIKPGNLLLCGDADREVTKLHDFGFAFATGVTEPTSPNTSPVPQPRSHDLTESHQKLGSLFYMAPEQAEHQRPEPSHDMYAFGVTLYELLTGDHAYPGCSLHETEEHKRAVDKPPWPVSRRRAGVPPRLAALVDECLSRYGADRPTAEEALTELGTVCAELGIADAQGKPQADATPAVAVESRAVASVVIAGEKITPELPRLRRKAEVADAAAVGSSPHQRYWAAAAVAFLGVAGLVIWSPWSPSVEIHRLPDVDARAVPSVVPGVAADVAGPVQVDLADADSDESDSDGSGDPQQSDLEDEANVAVPEPAQTKPRSRQPKPKTVPDPKSPPKTEPSIDCEVVLSAATVANQSRAWAKLFRLTNPRNQRCWSGDEKTYQQLRVVAAMKTKHYSVCVRASAGSQSPSLVHKHKFCSLKATQ